MPYTSRAGGLAEHGERSMPISATCPHCNTAGQVEDSNAGHTVKCPKCQQTFTARGMPEVAAVMPVWKKWLIILAIIILSLWGIGMIFTMAKLNKTIDEFNKTQRKILE